MISSIYELYNQFREISIFAAVTTILITSVALLKHNAKKPVGKKLPGPRGLPLVGNLLQIPKERPWVKMAEWTKIYGPIYRLKLGFSNLVVLGSPKVAIELLDRRSSKYSSRPRHIMTSEHVSRGLRMTFMPYGDLWKRERKLLHLLTQPKSAKLYEPIQSQESIQLCLDLIKSPENHWRHAQRYAGSTVLQITYSQRAINSSDRSITEMRNCNDKMIQTAVPGRYWVDSIPILNYLPYYICNWKKEASKIFEDSLNLFSNLYDSVAMNNDDENLEKYDGSRIFGDCFVKRIEILKDQYGLSRDHAVFLAGAMFGAGSDTTAAAIETFIFACATHPAKMIKAQEELDQTIGRDRLPQFSDQRNLNYCNAMIRELLRWRTVIPGGLAHMTTEDDTYEGYYIPKGTSVVANHWSIHLDEETYEDPEQFKPERFIDSGTGALKGTPWSEAGHHAFGFGRRSCPGIHIAERSLYITFSRILWAFEIIKYTDDDKSSMIDLNNFSTGFSSSPLPFKVKILPRDESVIKLLEDEADCIGLDALNILF
ncbi:cytochrome P450 [Phakopsora pachyrhizi]|uniref:Cytochrome P450 n=1 Tax=Phakopsora pachyrhizi TaxID=170000 RepID=A0AAV0BR77_PHAPC|nr:cytochrome P450 [Phakopsora pachyrhizi]CAH7688066.1 cytochrome P450 [Phakopsora pachyrhizi]